MSDFTSVVGTTKRMSVRLCPPSPHHCFSSDCDKDYDNNNNEPKSTYISLPFGFYFFLTAMLQVLRRLEEENSIRSTVVRCLVPRNNRFTSATWTLNFDALSFVFSFCTWKWV
ncbi:hypothetical protein AMECASPLE_028409 [Ameca splendens]|uniref:Transmembrane protein n=1 Tax=Ameca splendens TaxID=208324 RepID=A0ABV1ADX7_9TELE